MENNENIYKVFVASSMRIGERSTVRDAIEAANNNEIVKELHIHFEKYLYEYQTEATQKVERTGAQELIDRNLKESALFFLIIDEMNGDITLHEFELALKQFKEGKIPQYIFILCKKSLQSNGESVKYEKFLRNQNLIYYVADNHNNIKPHYMVYGIPFDDEKDLKEKIETQLLTFVKSKDKPFPRAVRGNNLTKMHFFIDENRKKNCPITYLRRDIDDKLDYAIKNRNYVILTGSSLSGKTRAVMEAMRAVEDGWVYVVRRELAAEELQRLSYYIGQNNHPKLYIVLDNFDQWIGDEQVLEALKKLLGLIGNSHDVIVGTATYMSRNIPNANEAEWIEIHEMNEREFAEAKEFFVSAGVQIDKRNLRFHRTGALFVDLESIMSDYYAWLNKDGDTDLTNIAKHMLLKTFKALSVWRDDNIGNRILMESLAKWFCSQAMTQLMKKKKCPWSEADIEEGSLALNACKDALNELISKRKFGISSAGAGSPVIVQEYIYRYFIDYDGSLLENDEKPSIEKEKELIKQLLLFCSETQKEESLTAQVSRLCRRCTFKKEIVSWLYGLWSGVKEAADSDHSLSEILQNDRMLCEQTDREIIKHLYSNLIETYIYYCCGTMEDALIAYNQCPKDKHTDHLLSALMRKAYTEEERADIRKTPDYQTMHDQAYVIAVQMEWADNYKQAKEWIKHFVFYQNRRNSKMIAQCIVEDEQPYVLLQLRRAISTLALKVVNSKEFDDFCGVVRDLYLCLVSDMRLLNKINNNQLAYQSRDLTLIDLLAVIQPNILKGMLGNAFGGNFVDSKKLIDKLIGYVGETLNRHFTDIITLRLTIGYAASQLIRKLREEPYEEVYKSIFKPLATQYKDKALILRSIYTYTAMLDNSTCNMQQADRLLKDDLIPHANSNDDNPLSINTFTLNKIMEKSKGKNRHFYIMAINRMFDESQLTIQRDAFTYCHLISVSTNLKEGLNWLKEMHKNRVKPNIFVLAELMKLRSMRLKTALTMVDLSKVDLPKGYMPRALDSIDGFDPNEMVNELRDIMSDSQIVWGYLLKKECYPGEEAVLSACLSFLESQKCELLEGGFIYNSLIANETYLKSAHEIVDFVSERFGQGLFRPDSHTACHVVDRITKLNGKTDRLKAMNKLNELLVMVMAGEECKLDEFIVNYRLRLFKDWTEDLKMDFYDEQGRQIVLYNKKKQQVAWHGSVFDYLIAMRNYGYPVNSSVIDNFLTISEIIPDTIYSKLSDEFHILRKPITSSEFNKSLLKQFKAGIISDIKEAVESLKWESHNAAIFTFTEILNHYIESQPRKTPEFFNEIKTYYKDWIESKGRILTTRTLSVLAKATICWDDILWLLGVFDEQKQKDASLTLEPQMLTAMSAYANTVKELKERTGMMLTKGCSQSRKAADTYVIRMIRHLQINDPDASVILNDLCRYIVEGGDAEQLLVMRERNLLLLNNYMDKQNVSASLLRALIYYDITRDEGLRYGVERMADCITMKYRYSVVSLMEKLAEDATEEYSYLPLREDMDNTKAKLLANEVAKQYILPKLFPALIWGSRPQLSSRLLSYMANNLQPTDLDNYRQFLEQLYETDCTEIEGAVSGLTTFLKNYLELNNSESENIAAARKALAQIIVYGKQKKLRNGHLLLKTIEDKYAHWCHYQMDYNKIYEQMKTEYDSISMPDLIMRHAIRLDDGYLCSLKFFHTFLKHYKQSDEKEIANDKVKGEIEESIRLQEQRYTSAILSDTALFKDVLKLPLMWIKAQWIPSEEIMMAIVRSLSRQAWNTDPTIYQKYKDDARTRYTQIIQYCTKAHSNKSEVFKVLYKYINQTELNDKFYIRIRTSAVRSLNYYWLLDDLAYNCAKGQCITVNDRNKLRLAERSFSNFIEKNSLKIAWLQQLPQLWKKIKVKDSRVKDHVWCPDTSIVFAILKNYNRIANGNGEEAGIARQYISQVKEAMKEAISYALEKKKSPQVKIKYPLLGITEDKGHYVLVSLNSLSKVIAP